MIEAEHLDIRTVTMGISLRDCPTDDMQRTCQRVYDKHHALGAAADQVAREVQDAYGVPITNKRISVTPIALVGEPSAGEFAMCRWRRPWIARGAELGIDYVAGFSALVEKGATPGDVVLSTRSPRRWR